ESERLQTIRLVATVSMIIVGVVYHALLGDSAVDPQDIGYEWPRIPNLVIHTWAPVAVVVDYFISIKSAVPKWRKALWVIVYPLVWLTFSIVRGLLDGWWPYWFINPNSEIGVSGMITYIVIIATAFVTLGFLVSGLRIALQKLIR
ncbi:MAG: Pr6Pr family membrane protein, partial [Aquiluna sp.]